MSDYVGMKYSPALLILACAAVLTSCESAAPQGGASSFRLSPADYARHREREERKAQEMAASHGAAEGGSLMYQSQTNGPFGSSTSTGAVQVRGPVEVYQTIGNTPVYPGMVTPGYPIYYPQPTTHYWGPTTVRRTVTP